MVSVCVDSVLSVSDCVANSSVPFLWILSFAMAAFCSLDVALIGVHGPCPLNFAACNCCSY